MYNLRSTLRTITKAPKLGVFTAIGAVIALTMLLAACPEEAPAPTGPTGPSSPANLDVEISDGQAELTWDAVAGATEYRIYSVGSDGTLTRIAEAVTITETTFTVTGLDNGTTYRYVVRAVNSAGIESGDSSEISATPALTIPPVPKNLTANPADAQVTLSWAASNSADEYRVYRASTPDGTLVRIAEGTTITETSYIDTGLTNGTEYRYTVRAFNIRGESTDSNEVTARPVASTVAPPAPANLTATAGDTEVSLSWDAVPGATEYRIYRAATAAPDPLARIAENDTIIVTTYTDTGLTNGTTYRYTVRAVNNIGEGIDSSEATAAPALAAPAAPTNLSATATASGQVTLTWDATDNTAEYQVFRADTVNVDFVRIADTTTITDPTYTDTGLANDTAYRYTVRAANAAGASPASSEASVTTLALPAAPANFSATAGDTQVLLSWDAVTGATEYRIYRAATANGALTRVTTNSDITGTTYTDTGLTNGTAYRYTVRAVDSVGESIDSNEVSATPGSPGPENLSATASVTGPGQIEAALSWDAVTGATEYRIYRAAAANDPLTRIAEAITITGTTYTDTGLQGSTAYRYAVRAVDSADDVSVNSNVVSLTTPALPAMPANFSATIGDRQITLSWDAVTGAAEYYVYRGIPSTGFLFRIASGTTISATMHTDTGLTVGTTYEYFVRAVNSTGVSANSNTISATALTPPAVPANLSAVASTTQVLLEWDAVDSAAEYRVYRAATANGALTRIASSTTITETTYTDTGLTNDTAYRYTVRASNSAGESTDSSEVTATPTAATAVPAAPANLSTLATSTQAVLSWDAVTGATEYRVYRAATSSGTLTRIASSTTITDTTYTDTGLTNVTTYRYTVRASNSIGEGVDSNEATARPDDHSNVFVGATPATSGVFINGNLDWLGDWDHFSIEIPGASSVTPVTITANTGGGTDTYGILYSSDGTVLTMDDDTGAGQNFRFAATVSSSGPYYLRVRGFNDNRTGPYTVTITAPQPPVIVTPDDHSHTPTDATPVTSGTAVTGTLNPSGDYDYFSIAVTTASTANPVTITAYTTGTTDTQGTLFDINAATLAANNNDPTTSGDPNFRLSTTVMENGTYFVRVDGRNNATGDYSLTVTAQ